MSEAASATERQRIRMRAANLAMYSGTGRVGGYASDRYHASRRELAVLAVTEAIDRRPLPGGPILEIGGNESPLVGSMPDLCRRVLAADISLLELRGCKGDPICLDADRPMPFADGTIAAVVVGELVEHLFDPSAFLREVYRVLGPDGLLVVTTPNLAGLQDRLRFLLGRSPRQIDPLHDYLYLHIRPFTAELLHRTIAQAGLIPSTLRSNFVGWQLGSGRWLMSRWLAKLLPTLGGSLIVAARKDDRGHQTFKVHGLHRGGRPATRRRAQCRDGTAPATRRGRHPRWEVEAVARARGDAR